MCASNCLWMFFSMKIFSLILPYGTYQENLLGKLHEQGKPNKIRRMLAFEWKSYDKIFSSVSLRLTMRYSSNETPE